MSNQYISVKTSGMRQFLTRGLLGVALLGTAVACNDRLTVPNYLNPTPESIQGDPVSAVPLLVTGVLRNDRDNHTVYISGVGILGRESYNYTPTEGRNTTGWLSPEVKTPSSFGGVALWNGYYTELRNTANLIGTLNGAATGIFTDGQKNAGLGYAHTMEGLSLSYVIATRYNLGAPVDISPDPAVLTPFVSRDSVYRYIVSRLDLGKTELTASGGAAFPFTLHAGYAGFTTPSNYLKFNRALAARINAYRASIGASGCGTARSAACYNTVLANLAESFINPAGSLTAGPFNVYSSAASDFANGISNQANSSQVAHAKADSGIQLKADGTKDARFTAKVITITTKRPANPTHGVGTNFDYSIYPLMVSPIPVLRNEELILLRAEARYFTGDVAGALADINTIRTTSGGLAPLAGFASESAFIDELLYNRRLSLLIEGHRWIDMRRFGRLNQLTLDLPTHVIISELPVPQVECLSRALADAALKGPGC